jgi:hypothetical protein
MFRRRESISSSAPLNWRRGLFRLWLLASAAWILAWGVYSILSAIAHAFVTPEDVVARAVVFFGPPVALCCVVWPPDGRLRDSDLMNAFRARPSGPKRTSFSCERSFRRIMSVD